MQRLREAIDRAIDSGVVVVVAAGNINVDVAPIMPQSDPDALTVSTVADSDFRPGGEGPGCEGGPGQPDEQRIFYSDFGVGVDIAFPHCGATSGATAKTLAAAAALASQCHPNDRAGVEFIVDTLTAEGDVGTIAEGGWKDTSGDGWQEPLLNLSNEDVFDPVLLSTTNPELNEQPPPQPCGWRSHQAESDVGSDGRADLVALDGGGQKAEVFAGKTAGYETDKPVASLSGQLDSALLDGTGKYAIDTADVNGDRRADLVTATDGTGVTVYPGQAGGGFGTAVTSLSGTNLAYVNPSGGIEPIAVADVDGDARADLVAHSASSKSILTYPGNSNGTLGAAIDSGLSVDSALRDSSGSYFLDVIDVTGEELDDPNASRIDYNQRHANADLVAVDTSGQVSVYPGDANGKFSAAVAAATINPIFDDGSGQEPIGLDDVDRDRRADLVTLDGGALKLYKAQANGTFAASTQAYEGTVDSSLMDGSGEELVGLLDYSRDGLADLVSVQDDGDVLAYTAQRDKTFAAPQAQPGLLPSIRQGGSGHELVAEKPLVRRAGCVLGRCYWPAKPPVAAYSFDEGAGTVLHDSAGSNDGSIEGPTWSAQGKYGSALDFNGANQDRVLIPDANDLDFTKALTVEAWVKPAGIGGETVLYKGNATDAYALDANYQGKPTGAVAKAGKTALASGPSALPANTWSHLAFTSDGVTVRLYVDGELVGSVAAVEAGATTSPLQLGVHPFLGTGFDGLIDEIRLYDRTLSASELAADKNMPLEPSAGLYLAGAQSTEESKQPRFEAVTYPLSIAGDQNSEGRIKFKVAGYTAECGTAALSGTLTAAAKSLSLVPQLSGCTTAGTYPTTIDVNSCALVTGAANSGPPYSGAASISCKEAEDGIELDIRTKAGAQTCLVKVPAHSMGGSIAYENRRVGATRTVTATLATSGMQWTRSGECVLDGKGSAGSNGELSGELRLFGSG